MNPKLPKAKRQQPFYYSCWPLADALALKFSDQTVNLFLFDVEIR
jgi:hypothetical protein